jgi:glutaconate CoA-transferase, subunit A
MDAKLTSLDSLVAEIHSGMTLGIGGWGSRRKPMAVVRALLNSDVTDLTVVSYGGPDVGLLVDAGKVKKVICGFVTLDSIALDPLWRSARQAGAVELMEVDEGMFYLGLQAAAWRVPFLPTRAGLGSSVLDETPAIKTMDNPYQDGPFANPITEAETLVAMPALNLDVAVIHVNVADEIGNAMILAPDPFFDDLFLGAATTRLVTAEEIVPAGTLSEHGPLERATIHRLLTDKIALAPNGAHFTANPPNYGRDEAFQKYYAQAAKDPETWNEFTARFLGGDEASYQAAVEAWRKEQ